MSIDGPYIGRLRIISCARAVAFIKINGANKNTFFIALNVLVRRKFEGKDTKKFWNACKFYGNFLPLPLSHFAEC